MRPARARRRGRMKRGIMLALPSLRAQRTYVVIPGRCEAANPESRDSPVRNCAPEVWSFGPSRNDGACSCALLRRRIPARTTDIARRVAEPLDHDRGEVLGLAGNAGAGAHRIAILMLEVRRRLALLQRAGGIHHQ